MWIQGEYGKFETLNLFEWRLKRSLHLTENIVNIIKNSRLIIPNAPTQFMARITWNADRLDKMQYYWW